MKQNKIDIIWPEEMKALNKELCPFCYNNTLIQKEEGYYCSKCERNVYDEDFKREYLRHRLSAILMDTSEEHCLECNIIIMENNDENCGLSSNDLPLVTGAFQDTEGIIWFNIYGMLEPVEFDELDIEDIETIYKTLSK